MASKTERVYMAAIFAWVEAIREPLTPDRTERLIEIGATELIVGLSPYETANATLRSELQEILGQIIERTGAEARDDLLPEKRLRKQAFGTSFELDNPYSIPWIEEHAASAVTLISETTRQAIRVLLVEGFEAGIAPAALARQLQEVIGLRPDQVETLDRMRNALSADGVSAEDIARQLERRSARMLRQRALLIARTETIAAENAGLQHSWEDAQDHGLLGPYSVKEWLTVRPRGPHGSESCSALDGQRVPIRESFHDPVTGTDFYTPPAHPNCRSGMGIVNLSAEEFAALAA